MPDDQVVAGRTEMSPFTVSWQPMPPVPEPRGARRRNTAVTVSASLNTTSSLLSTQLEQIAATTRSSNDG